MSIRALVWNEFRHERSEQSVREIYPDGIHSAIAGFLNEHDDIDATTATLDEPEHGLTVGVLDATDVLLWWGHLAHDEVDDAIVTRVQERVLSGMGLIVLHSGHYSKVFRRLLGTTGLLRWREAAERERLWNLAPNHEITAGIGDYLEIEHAEMYGERFDIPEPDKLIFISWFEGGEVMRSGCTWDRGNGRIFYFRPGHETYPIYHMPEIQRVIANAVRWAHPRIPAQALEGPHVPDALEVIGRPRS
ncbi:MAG: ThuA domain-containing protein [Spirochaetota bacterium]